MGLVRGAGYAIGFLTILPVRIHGHAKGADHAPVWFPLVGAMVGALAGGAWLLAEPELGASVASVLALIVLVVVTGALHQDGLADCADGLGVRGERRRRLEVMRDSAIGTFGTLALLAWGLLLTATLAGLTSGEAFRALVTAGAVGRWACLLHATTVSPAHRDGLGAGFNPGPVAVAVATATTTAGVLAIDGVAPGLGSVAVGAAVAVLIGLWSRATLGGRTGDTLGATVALTEVAVCLTLLGFAGS